MKLRWVLCAQLWACQALAIEPGQGFAVHLDWPLVAQHIQSVEPLTLQFRVDHCERFTTVVQHRGLYSEPTIQESWRDVPATALPDGHGRYTASLEVDTLLDYGTIACWADADHPERQELRLAVTCSGDGRQAVSSTIPLQYAAATQQILRFRDEARALHVIDANRLLMASPAGIHIAYLDQRTEWGAIPEISQQVGLGDGSHLMAHTDTHAYVGSDCMYPRCTAMTVEDPATHARITLESADVFAVDLRRPYDPNGHEHINGMVQVPGPIVHMFADTDGSLLVVSHVPYPQSNSGGLGRLGGTWNPGVVVSRITGDSVHTEAVLEDVIAAGAKISDAGLFLTATQERLLHLRSVRVPHEGMRLDGGAGAEMFTSVWPSPDGHHWVVGTQGRDEVCAAATGTCRLLETSRAPRPLMMWANQPVWLSDGLARVVDESETVGLEIFNLDGSLRGVSTLPRSNLPRDFRVNQLLTLSGDRIAMTDKQHVRVFDRMGHPLGGTVLPQACSGAAGLAEIPGNKLVWMSVGQMMQSVFVMDL